MEIETVTWELAANLTRGVETPARLHVVTAADSKQPLNGKTIDLRKWASTKTSFGRSTPLASRRTHTAAAAAVRCTQPGFRRSRSRGSG